MIDISVIMPVFNEEKYLHEAMDSILHQTFGRFEFIIVDDASTDNSLAIIQSYADERIVLICNEQNIGNYPSRNKGLEIAVGKYICVMDADDVAYPQRLELQYQYLEACSDLWILGTGLDFSIPGMKWTLPSSHEQLMIGLLQGNVSLHSSLMIRTDVMRKYGGYDEKYVYSSDYDLISRFSLSSSMTSSTNGNLRSWNLFLMFCFTTSGFSLKNLISNIFSSNYLLIHFSNVNFSSFDNATFEAPFLISFA